MPFVTLNLDGEILGEYPLEQNRLVKIGRLEGNDIIINDSSVSGNHAEIEFENERFFLTDRQSKNGTFVNNIQLNPNTGQHLRVGDELRFGDQKFILE